MNDFDEAIKYIRSTEEYLRSITETWYADYLSDAVELLEAKQHQELTAFEVLDMISSAYYGKQIFFLQDDGSIYSRLDGTYVTLQEAIQIFINLIEDEVW